MSLWFYFVGLGVVALVVLFLIFYYPNEQTTPLVKCIVGITWFAALSVLVLVPSDIANTLKTATTTTTTDSETSKHSEKESVYDICWLFVYWYTLTCMVVILPLLQQYADSGGFHVQDRIIHSLKINSKNWAIMAILAIFGVVLLILTKNFNYDQVMGWVMAISNAYGLVGALFLLGFGLVDIPRKLWFKADIRKRELFMFQQAGIQLERATNAHKILSKNIAIVYKVSSQFGRNDELKPYVERIEGMIERVGNFQPQIVTLTDEDLDFDCLDRRDLGELRGALRKSIEGYYRERERYKRIIKDYLRIHETLKNMGRAGLPYEFLGSSENKKELPKWIGYVIWWWACRVKPMFMKSLAVVLGIFSLSIVVAEVAMSPYVYELSVFYYLITYFEEQEIAVSIISFLLLFYVMMCTYYTLFRIRIFSFYLLVPRHTAPISLISNALFMCRFVSPLCYNFLTALVLPYKAKGINVKNTEFWNNIGENINDAPFFGYEFTTYAPVIILPYILLVIFNAFNYIVNIFDKKHRYTFDDDWDITSSYASTGKVMLNKEIINYDNGLEIGLTISEDLNKTTLNELLNAEYTPMNSRTGLMLAHNESMTRQTIGGGGSGKLSPHILTPVVQYHHLKPSVFSSSKPGETSNQQLNRERAFSANYSNTAANTSAAPYLASRAGSSDTTRANLDALFRDLRFREHYMHSRGSNAPSVTSASTDRHVHSSMDESEKGENTRWFRTGRRR